MTTTDPTPQPLALSVDVALSGDHGAAFIAARNQVRAADVAYSGAAVNLAGHMLRTLFPSAAVAVFGVDYSDEDTPGALLVAVRDAAGRALWHDDAEGMPESTLPEIDAGTRAHIQGMLADGADNEGGRAAFVAGHGEHDDDACPHMDAYTLPLTVTGGEPVRDAFDAIAYRAEWSQSSTHEVDLSTRELADLLGKTPEEVAAAKVSDLDTLTLEDTLSEVGEGCLNDFSRHDVQLSRLSRRPR